jgi:glutathione S-transferase
MARSFLTTKHTHTSSSSSSTAGGTYKGWSVAATLNMLGTAARGALGAFVLPGAASFPRPATRLTLYAYEGCPFCQKVREGLTLLDLDYLHRPCPKGGTVWRPVAAGLVEAARGPGSRPQFPLLVDGGKPILESTAILQHLFDAYGPGWAAAPALLRVGALANTGTAFSRLVRPGRGVRAAPTKATADLEPLHLWGYEPSPFVRVVREVMDELEVAVVSETAARGSVRRPGMLTKWGGQGKAQFPYLEDPNTGVAMYESDAIVAYLRATYGK